MPKTKSRKRSDVVPAGRVPQQQRARKSLERILSTAEVLIEQNGFEQLTMSALADAAQVSIGGIYQHFPDKFSILVRVQDRVVSRIEKDLTERISRAPSNLEDVTCALVDGTAASFLQNPTLMRAFIANVGERSPLSERAKKTYKLFERIFSERLLACGDEVQHENSKLAARMTHALITAMMCHLVSPIWTDDKRWRENWFSHCEEIKRVCLAYLRSRPARNQNKVNMIPAAQTTAGIHR